MEDTKFKADMTSALPISAAYGGRHTFVPFAMEDGGRIEAHGHAFLRMLAEHAVTAHLRSPVRVAYALKYVLDFSNFITNIPTKCKRIFCTLSYELPARED